MRNIDKEISDAEEALRRLKLEKEAMPPLNPTEVLAEQLHRVMCRMNHTDACSWEYGNWRWRTHAHEHYAKIAHKLIQDSKYGAGELARILSFIDA